MPPVTSLPAAGRLGAAALVLVLGLSSAACSGASMRRLDPMKDDDVGGTMIDSLDVESITAQAAAEIAPKLLASPRNDLIVHFPAIKNESRQQINTALFSDPIRDRVLAATSPRVKFLAREQLDEIEKEREAKRAGVFSGAERKQLLGATHLLTGRIKSLSKTYESETADYFQISLQLVDAEDSSIIWTNTWTFKKQGDAGVIYQ